MDLRERLLTAFRAESGEQTTGIREVLRRDAPTREELDEAFRLAHSMKGGARVCDLPEVEAAAHRLESLFAELRSQGGEAMVAMRSTLLSLLDEVEDHLRRELATPAPEPVEGEARAPDEEKPAPAKPGSVRLTTAHLDRLLSISGQLMVETVQDRHLAQEFSTLVTTLGSLARQVSQFRERFRAGTDAPEAGAVAELDLWRETLAEAHLRAKQTQRGQAARSTALRSISSQLSREVTSSRLVVASSAFEGLGAMVREVARESGREISFEASGLELLVDRAVLQGARDPVIHLLRNAVVHGIEAPAQRRASGKPEQGMIRLLLETRANRLRIVVQDDGAGIPLENVRRRAAEAGIIAAAAARDLSRDELLQLVFHPGLSTAAQVNEMAGRGMGLSIVAEAARRLGGSVSIQTQREKGTSFEIETALTVSAEHVILAQAGDQLFGIPTRAVQQLLRVRPEEIRPMQGGLRIEFGQDSLPVASLAALLGVNGAGTEISPDPFRKVIVLRFGERRVCLLVDSFVDQEEVIVQDLDGPAALPLLAGACFVSTGALVPVVHIAELFARFRPATEALVAAPAAGAPAPRQRTVLVVDDSFTTRTLERSILEAQGFRVWTAVDGVEALGRLRADPVDLVISDIQMPRMDGFTLVTEIKADTKLKDIPVILVSSMEAQADQERGLAVGAEAYIVKRKFDHQELIETIRQLL